ncbi:hypothetical protein ABIE27_001577 [Paenibacillus sp. 4624]
MVKDALQWISRHALTTAFIVDRRKSSYACDFQLERNLPLTDVPQSFFVRLQEIILMEHKVRLVQYIVRSHALFLNVKLILVIAKALFKPRINTPPFFLAS